MLGPFSLSAASQLQRSMPMALPRIHYRFWEGALAAAPDLEALVRELEVIDAEA